MVQMFRVRVEWTGFVGAPGYTNLFFRDFNTPDGPIGDGDVEQATAAVTRARTFFDAIKGLCPAAVRWTFPSTVDVIESTTGELTGGIGVVAPANVQATGVGSYSAPNGAVVSWRTNTIRTGRRIRGRTFIVPLNNSSFGTDGQIIAGSVATLKAAADALASSAGSPDLVIWARPTGPGTNDGSMGFVTAATVPSKAAVLRSRRD